MICGVIGLGKLGLPYALTLAESGCEVLAWDHDPAVRETVAQRVSHIDEPLVDEMLLVYTLELVEPEMMRRRADVVFIIVPTPSLPNTGAFDTTHVRSAMQSLGMISDLDFALPVALVSTVSPGSLTDELVPLAEKLGFSLVYAPTFIALGSVIRDLTIPDVCIAGCDTQDQAWHRVVLVLRTMSHHTVEVLTMDYESAAIAKLASNVFVTLKISFANVLAQLCDRFGGDVDRVTDALGYNKRIGRKSLTAGAGFGGPCFPRDASAFAAAGAHLGDTVLNLNYQHLGYIVERVLHIRPYASTYYIIGRAYKQDTNYRIESFGDKIAAELDGFGMKEVKRVAQTPLPDEALQLGITEDSIALPHADVVVIALPFIGAPIQTLKPGAAVFDLWRTHGYLDAYPDITYVPLGKRMKRDRS